MKKGNVEPIGIVLSYTSFVSQTKDDMNYCTTIEKFVQDVNILIGDGYVCIPLREHFMIINGQRKAPKVKYFCLAFQGGYYDNYQLAFPIIKKYNLPVAIFVATDLIGVSELKNSAKFIPHFGWDEAQEMVDSGLVSIHPMWHPMDFDKDFPTELKKKIDLLNYRIINNEAGLALSYSRIGIDNFEALVQCGVKGNLVDCFLIDRARWKCRNVPIITVNHTSDILDVVDQFNYFVYENLQQGMQELNHSAESAMDDIAFCESITLPIDLNPMIKNYLRHAFSLSIIQSHRMERAERIVLSDFIDVVFKPDYHLFDFHTYGYESMKSLDYMRIARDFFDVNPISVNTVILNGLKKGYYSDIWLDTYYIPGKPGYKKYHKTHGILIFGFDCKKRVYSVLSYTSEGLYREITVPVEAVELGCSDCFFTHLTMLKSKKAFVPNYDVNDLKIKLLNYLESRCWDDNTRFNEKSVTQYYNFEASLRFEDYIMDLGERNESIPWTTLYSYAEQKKIMAWRIQYISTKENLPIDKIASRVAKTNNYAELIVNLGIKYSLDKSKKTLYRIKDIVHSLNKEEKVMLHELIVQLK